MKKAEKPLKPKKRKASANAAVKAFQKAFSNKDIFFQFLDKFPFMIEIFALDGTSVYVNMAGYQDVNVADPNEIVGNYNVLKDPVVMDVLGMREGVERIFRGEAGVVTEVRVPFEDLSERYTQIDKDFSGVMFQKITGFSVRDEEQDTVYIVMIFETTHTYKSRNEIAKAEEYMRENWQIEFDLDKIAEAVNLSPYYFLRLFKQQTGVTPYTYYKEIKIGKLKEKLLDPNLNVTQAFAACGVDTHGRYLRFFKEFTGMTPSKYRREKFRTKI